MHLQLRFPAFTDPTSGKSMRTISCALALTLATLPAWAQTRDENVKQCMSDHPDISISGCTALIQSGQESTANMAAAYNKRGEAYYDNFEDEHAVADYTKAIEIRSDYAEAYSNRCAAEDDQGYHDKAIADCTKAITLKPDYAEAYNNRGKAYNFKNLHDQTIADCSRAIALKPDYAEAYGWRAHAYQSKGEDAKGLRDAEKAVALAPKEDGINVRAVAVKSRALGTMAEIYEKLGQRDKAIANYIASCARCPWVQDALKRLGAPIPTEEQLSASQKEYAGDSWEQKWLAAVKQQDWNVALQNLLVAQEIDPESPTVLFNLGLTSEKIPGHELRAIAWFQAYLLVAPAAPDAAAVRNEVARLEVSYEARNRAILDGIDSFILLAKTNVDQLSKERGPEWAKFASLEMRDTAELQAGSRYFLADESGALRGLHVADETLFRDGSLDLPFPSPLLTASRQMASAMLSSGFNVEEVVYGAKPRDFTENEIAQLDYLLEAGDLAHALTFLRGWPPNNATWILGAERFLCTAHDRSDSIMLDKASLDIQKALNGSLAAGWAYSDFVRLYLEMGEVSRAEALAKAIPADLERQTLQSYELPADKRVIAGTANGLLEDFHQRRIQSQGRCSGELSVLMESSPNSQTLQWGRGPWVGGGTTALWWSTGRIGFLTDVGRHGVKNESSSDFDETRLSEYVKNVSAEILPNPNLIAVGADQLAGFEFRVMETYRQVRGPVRSNADAHNNRRIGYENQGLYDRAHYSKAVAMGVTAANGHLDEIRYWVARGADVNGKDDKGRTPLQHGAINGHLDVVQYLVAQGADVNAKDSDGFTVLHTTVLLKGNLEVVQYLVAHGADVNARDKEGSTPLCNAALAGSLDVVQYLVTHGADVRATNNDGMTALHMAAFKYLDVAEYLVSHGADVNARDKEGSTPLQFAAYNGQLDVARYLVDNGGDVNARDKTGSTALGNAQKQGKAAMVEYLSAHGGSQ